MRFMSFKSITTNLANKASSFVFETMLTRMFGSFEYSKVLNSIINLISIDVVNYFINIKLSIKMVLHKMSCVWDFLSIDSNHIPTISRMKEWLSDTDPSWVIWPTHTRQITLVGTIDFLRVFVVSLVKRFRTTMASMFVYHKCTSYTYYLKKGR